VQYLSATVPAYLQNAALVYSLVQAACNCHSTAWLRQDSSSFEKITGCAFQSSSASACGQHQFPAPNKSVSKADFEHHHGR